MYLNIIDMNLKTNRDDKKNIHRNYVAAYKSDGG